MRRGSPRPVMEDLVKSGLGRSRVEEFLLGTLRVCTQQRYAEALEVLGTRLQEDEGITIDGMDEEGLDYWIADWMVEETEAGALASSEVGAASPSLPRSFFGAVLSAVTKTRPRFRLKVAWKVYNAWGFRLPPKQAPAAPPEVLIAVAVLLLACGRFDMGTVVVVCHTALLRVGGALQLKRSDLVLGPEHAVFLLGRATRGLEQKVTVTSLSMIQWLREYTTRFP